MSDVTDLTLAVMERLAQQDAQAAALRSAIELLAEKLRVIGDALVAVAELVAEEVGR